MKQILFILAMVCQYVTSAQMTIVTNPFSLAERKNNVGLIWTISNHLEITTSIGLINLRDQNLNTTTNQNLEELRGGVRWYITGKSKRHTLFRRYLIRNRSANDYLTGCYSKTRQIARDLAGVFLGVQYLRNEFTENIRTLNFDTELSFEVTEQGVILEIGYALDIDRFRIYFSLGNISSRFKTSSDSSQGIQDYYQSLHGPQGLASRVYTSVQIGYTIN